MKVYTHIMTDFGKLFLVAQGQQLLAMYVDGQKHMPKLDAACHYDPNNMLFLQAEKQLREYLSGARQKFTVPCNFTQGTEFQKRVWTALSAIPYGITVSYQDLAQQIGHPTSVRALGAAVGKNPLMLIIPCHRVIGHDGSLTGYAAGIELKKRFLTLEKATRLL